MKQTIKEHVLIVVNKFINATNKEREASKKDLGVPQIYGEQTNRGYIEIC